MVRIVVCMLFFFFQAEDGIRDGHVTGVQTCALPICLEVHRVEIRGDLALAPLLPFALKALEARAEARRHLSFVVVRRGEEAVDALLPRSEERRVGKECRARWGASDANRDDGDDVAWW